MKFLPRHNAFKHSSSRLGAANQLRNDSCEQPCSKESEMTMSIVIPSWCQNTTILLFWVSGEYLSQMVQSQPVLNFLSPQECIQ